VTGTSAEELLDVIEAFLGNLHCGAQSAGIDALLAADLTFSQMRTLLDLAHHPDPAPINELATRLGLSVAAAGRNVDQLVRSGLVDRDEDQSDRRVKRISLSGAGFDLIASFKGGQRRFALDVLGTVGEHDVRRLLEALRPIVAKLGCPPRAQAEGSRAPLARHHDQHHEHRQEIPG
jgi:DNA-binding MarR family transcriptional regulator